MPKMRDEHDKCFYCENYLSVRHEHDHFPVPQRGGGTETVPSCLNCHDMKDRQPLDVWPASLTIAAMCELLAIWPQDQILPDWRDIWTDLSPAARLLYGKFAAIDSDNGFCMTAVAYGTYGRYFV